MRVLVAVVGLLACVCAAEVSVFRNYHAEVGIPLAARIKENEEKIKFPEEPESNRIIGGVHAPANAHPHFAGLLIDLINPPIQSVCGSTLLTASRLVTAAHCWSHSFQAWRFTVMLGTPFLYSGGVRIATTNIVVHPQYNMQTLQNDIAMIYLPFPVSFSASIQPAALPRGADTSQSFVNLWANAVGFGATTDSSGASTILSHVNLQVISFEQCRAIYGAGWIFQSTLCTSGAGGVGVCGGDSGGPLTAWRNGQNTLIGVTSFAADKACEQGFPSGFARVTSFLSFIHQHM